MNNCYPLLKFEHGEGEDLIYPVLQCAWCESAIRNVKDAIIGYYHDGDDNKAKIPVDTAIALHVGRCDSNWSSVNGRIERWHHAVKVISDILPGDDEAKGETHGNT